MISNLKQRAIKNVASVASVEEIGHGLVAIQFEPKDRPVSWRAGQVIGVMTDPSADKMKDRWRHYTIRGVGEVVEQLELLVALHKHDGPGESWAANLAAGDTFTFLGPVGGSSKFSSDRDLLFFGDRTGLATFDAYRSALDEGYSAKASVLTPDAQETGIDSWTHCRVRWLKERADGAANNTAKALLNDVTDDELLGSTVIVCGERELVSTLRSELLARGTPKKQLHCQAHWTPGRTGM